MRNKIFMLLVVTLFSGYFVNAIDKSTLDSYCDNLNTHNKILGSVAIDSAGVELYSQIIGNQDGTYEIGSISKTFTAVMVMKAIEAGKLTYNTKLSTYFPQIKNSEQITIEMLLRHRTGIKSYTDDTDDFNSWHTEPQSEDAMVTRIAGYDSMFVPNTKLQYSNSNYTLLAYILTKIYSMPYSQLLEEQVVRPLGLKNTFFANQSRLPMLKSYRYFDKWRVEDTTHPTAIIGAAGIQSIPTDLNKFFMSIIEGKLVNREALSKMTDIKDGMGIGLITVPFKKQIGYGFSGGIDGFNSISVYFPQNKIAYTFLSNGLNCILNDISIDMLMAANGDKIVINSFDPTNIPMDILKTYTGVYSTPTLPIKMEISLSGNTLIAQGSGQPSFPLTPTSYDTFTFKTAGITLIFQPLNKTLTLKQGGATFLLNKE